MPNGTTGSLKTIAKIYKNAIAEDLHRLKLSGLLTTAAQNHFIPMPASTMYVYVHKEYIKKHQMFSSQALLEHRGKILRKLKNQYGAATKKMITMRVYYLFSSVTLN